MLMHCSGFQTRPKRQLKDKGRKEKDYSRGKMQLAAEELPSAADVLQLPNGV